ncbi:MAG TPA: peroxiredoxin [Gammaproteobacteria bacterium]
MRKFIAIRLLLTALLAFPAAALSADDGDAGPAVGNAAPGFRLQDQNGDWQSLEDYRGQWVVLYFYPKDDTPGCTTEACNFRDEIYRYKAMGAAVLGVSLDDVASHQEFAEKYELPFPLLADVDHDAARKYDVLTTFGPIKVAHRETFLIDPKGRIAKHYADVDPDVHAKTVLTDLESLMMQDKKPATSG